MFNVFFYQKFSHLFSWLTSVFNQERTTFQVHYTFYATFSAISVRAPLTFVNVAIRQSPESKILDEG